MGLWQRASFFVSDLVGHCGLIVAIPEHNVAQPLHTLHLNDSHNAKYTGFLIRHGMCILFPMSERCPLLDVETAYLDYTG